MITKIFVISIVFFFATTSISPTVLGNESVIEKKSKEEEEEIQEYYNVSVYRVLPYPLNTKDEKDFFIQKN